MPEYDEQFAQQRKRRSISGPKDVSCGICTWLHGSSASDYEWPCLILRDWICETHCVEIKDSWGEGTRGYVFQILGVSPDSMGEDVGHAHLMETCKRCPYLDF